MKRTIVIAGIAALVWAGAVISASAQTTQDPAQTTRSARTWHERHRLLEERFKRLDKNNDGRISRDEWPRRGRAFDRLDRNHDGVLTQDELRQPARNRRRKR